MQNDVSYLRCFAETAEPFAAGERYRSASGKNLGRIIQKDLVHYACGKCSPVYQRAAFNQQAGDFKFAQAGDDPGKVRTSVTGAQRNLFHTNSIFLELTAFLFFSEGTKNHHVIFGGLDQPRFERTAQTGIEYHAQQWTPAGKSSAV